MLGLYRVREDTMTEGEWLEATDWRQMTAALASRKGVARKKLLFAAACAGRVAHLFGDPRSDAGLAAGEQLADRRLTRTSLRGVIAAAHEAVLEEYHARGANGVAWARD
ncbi:MAG: hypothetical protein K2V38_22845, partial [Gemmataceae bacterium]|nr:hypothetical protein [Gemmataceae bacterium]